jgi:hypothetical protein
MDRLQLREAEIFRTLDNLKGIEFVLIGGYAVNSYALPRFSVDCDIVIRKEDTEKIKGILSKSGYCLAKNHEEVRYEGKFLRMEKILDEGFVASIDILVDEVHDRQSKARFSADWIFKNSKKRTIIGKTIIMKIEAKIIDADALFVMKFASARNTDIRDVFMMADKLQDFNEIMKEIEERKISNQSKKIWQTLEEKQFKDNLQGVYGYLDESVFNKHMARIKSIISTKS